MGTRIVKQPNGKLARFSEVVDNFTHCNMDQDEAIIVCKNEGMRTEAALAKVQRGIDDLDQYDYSKVGSGLDRWNEALLIIEEQHGKDELNRVLWEINNTASSKTL